MIALLIGGTVVLCIGLLTVVFGIPIKEFSFGNTMILAGAVVSCTGLILIGLYFVGREFRNLARRLETGLPAPVGLPHEPSPRELAAEAPPPIRPARTLPETPLAPRPIPPRPGREDTLFTRDQPQDLEQDRDDFAADARDDRGRGPLSTSEPAPWPEHPVTRARNPAPATESFEPPAEPAERQRRNIMFSSHRRDKARELPPRDPPLSDSTDRPAAEYFGHREPEPEPRGTFDSAWPSSRPESNKGRQDSPLPRNERSAPSSASDHDAPEPVRERFPPRRSDASSVTIVKSGVVDSMAYSLYSDGSIEAQMPEGMVRFASIDELRAHLDQRG